jgi:hypothetical protein
MIEFALCAPLVFGILFSVINGGLFMYARNSVARAANVAIINEAAEGNATSVDTDTLAAMRSTGVGAQSLVGVQWVKISEVAYNSSTQTYNVVGGCIDSNLQTVLCEDKYDINGNPLWGPNPDPMKCNALNQWCPPWPPSARSVHASTASTAQIDIHYTFTFLGIGSSFTFDEVHVFRLEPKDL